MSIFKFSVGPWNVHDGTDGYDPAVRKPVSLEEKIKRFAGMGISAIQFHDDDAVPDMNKLTNDEIIAETMVKTVNISDWMLKQ